MVGERVVVPGDRRGMTADMHNKLLRQIQRGGNAGGGAIQQPRQFDFVWARNDTGGNLARHAVVSLEGALFGTTDTAYYQEMPAMKATLPDWRKGPLWGITLDGVPADYATRVVISGVCPVQLKGNQYLDVAGPDVTQSESDPTAALLTGRGDCQVLYQSRASASTRWGLVWLGGPQIEIEGEITSVGNTPSSGKTDPEAFTLKAWRYADSQSLGVSQRQMEMIDSAINAVNRDPSLTMTEGAYCRVRWVNHEWRAVWVGC